MIAISNVNAQNEIRRLTIRKAQSLISDAKDIAAGLRVFVFAANDVYAVKVVDECDREVSFLCQEGVEYYSTALAGVDRVKERLESDDPDLLTGLLAHADGYSTEPIQ